MTRIVIVIATMLVVVACSSDDKDANSVNTGNNNINATNAKNNTDKDAGVDQKIIPDLNMDDDANTTCGEAVYPCGVYGTRKGDVIENDEFFGYKDPQSFCKEAKLRELDLSDKITMEFGTWFRKPEGSCDKKKLLWVMVSAGWCGPCIQEIQEVMTAIKSGAAPFSDPRLDYVDILFEDGDSQPITEKFAKESWSKTGLTFPLLLDPEFKMGKYFDRESVPFNMLVDLETMKVVYSQTGSNMMMMRNQINAFLN